MCCDGQGRRSMANIGEAQISKSHLLVSPAILLGLSSKIMVRPYAFRFGKIHDSHDTPLQVPIRNLWYSEVSGGIRNWRYPEISETCGIRRYPEVSGTGGIRRYPELVVSGGIRRYPELGVSGGILNLWYPEVSGGIRNWRYPEVSGTGGIRR